AAGPPSPLESDATITGANPNPNSAPPPHCRPIDTQRSSFGITLIVRAVTVTAIALPSTRKRINAPTVNGTVDIAPNRPAGILHSANTLSRTTVRRGPADRWQKSVRGPPRSGPTTPLRKMAPPVIVPTAPVVSPKVRERVGAVQTRVAPSARFTRDIPAKRIAIG